MKPSTFIRILLIVLILLTTIKLIGFRAGVQLMGAGATFPYPLYETMFEDYYKKTGIRINYQAIGSGGGVRRLLSKEIDFGGTDVALDDEWLHETDAEILHIPICLGAVVLAYNLPGIPELRLDPQTLTDIFLGNVTRWNDERLARLNPLIKFPDIPITVVRRSDSSGTTSIFSNYLSKVSAEWKERVGEGTSLDWVVGTGSEGNVGVTEQIKKVTGSIGYIELIYALREKIPYAALKNKAGNFIAPSLASVTLSANVDFPSHSRISLTDTDAQYGYPISGFTWIIIHREQYYNRRTKIIAEATIRLIEWMISDGQKHTSRLQFAPLPEPAAIIARDLLGTVTYKGEKLK